MKTKEILKKLIEFNTINDKENKEILDFIQNLLEEKGFRLEYRSKCLVISTKEKCKLGFIGHTDTVQYGDDWTCNPLELTEKKKENYMD